MTCKKHTILAALRKLREEGHTGKINPALIRELTGIERTGTILCELRTDGHLIDAGTIYLPAHRGKTLANEYTINPESDLMPKDRYDVSTHQSRKRQQEQRSAMTGAVLNGYLLGNLMGANT